MTFEQAISIVKNVLNQIGTPISANNYDGMIVKKLEASNTLDEGRTTKQTHIAITGPQMDIFPYLKADGYFVNNDDVLKKYFLVQAPITLFESNCKYLSMTTNDVAFDNGKIGTTASIVRSKRENAADQIQMSLISLDDKTFVEFRKALHAGSYLVVLKIKNRFTYHVFGIKPESISDDFGVLNNKFFKLPTNTLVNADSDFCSQFDGESLLSHSVYGIHITGKNNALSENDPHICIGGSKMGDLSDCTDRDSISAKHAETWPDAKANSRSQNVGQIYRFVVESQIGDYVVFGDGSTAHIGVIKSDYYYQENPQDQDLDYVNNKRVEWLKDVPYAELSVQFKNSLGSAMSFFRLNDYKSVIADLLNDTYEKDDDVDITAYDYKQVSGSGSNLVIYGTPGCGKSYYVMHDLLMEDQQEKADAFKKDHIFRTTFYQDYTNTDFVGQVMPVVQYQKDESGTEESIVTYKFVPGPFTLALECAIANPTEKVALVIEELNRGNAASIFGDLFQLLDRVSEGEKSDFPLCTSEYGILNVNIVAYLKDCEHYDKKCKYSYDLNEIRIPANLYIYATMNTSDQNVYTLDTAFKRRWGFEKLKNIFKDNHDYADYLVPGMPGITWKQLVTDINMFIVSDSNMLAAEDKQIGVYFIGKNLLLAPNTELSAEEVKKKQEKFAYKLFEYLWDDVAKFSHDRWFGKIKTLDELIEKFMNGEKVFADGIIIQKDQ